MNKYAFTVFTPTYNRASLIHRVYDSLLNQTEQDFEWLVVDDGSTDGTCEVIQGYIEEGKLEIRYINKGNEGKAAAINDGLGLAKGAYFLVLDSDDWCDSNALSEFGAVLSSLNDEEKETYSGVSCLKRYQDGSLVGEDYSRMNFQGETYIDRFNKRIKGDKWELIRTDLYRLNKYKLAAGEKYMAPEYAWVKIGSKYKTLFLNKALSTVEYQEDGISKNNIKHRVQSATNTCEVYKYYISISDGWFMKTRCLINLYRFRFHKDERGSASCKDIVPLSLAFILYVYDKLKLQSSGI